MEELDIAHTGSFTFLVPMTYEKYGYGDYTLLLTTKQGDIIAQATFKIVAPPQPGTPQNQRPSLTPIDDVVIQEGEFKTVTSQASDPDGNHLALNYNVPTFVDVKFENNIVTLHIAPPIGYAGTYACWIEVVDDGSPPELAIIGFKIIVKTALPPPASYADICDWLTTIRHIC